MQTLNSANLYRHTGTATETVISTVPCIVYGITPEATTTGTITLRNSKTAAATTAVHIAAIGLTQQGKDFGAAGVFFSDGLTVQNSVAGDASAIIWAAK
jgi:hypothetical protein